MKSKVLLSASAISLAIAGCSDPQATVSIGITDAAVRNADNVFLTINGLTLNGPDGQQSIEFAEAKQIDLLSLTGSASAPLIEDELLTAGDYSWIRLDVETSGELDSYVELSDGSQHEITIPSDVLKLNRGFTLPANGSADFILDVDLQKALVLQGSQYSLKPVIRMLDQAEVGHIAGTVASEAFVQLVDSAACDDLSVYAFAGADATVNDLDGSEDDAVLVATVDVPDAGEASYELGFLVSGSYTLALACFDDGDVYADDDPEVSQETGADAVTFLSGDNYVVNVVVTDGETTTQNF